MPAWLILRLARVMRCPTVDSGTRKAYLLWEPVVKLCGLFGWFRRGRRSRPRVRAGLRSGGVAVGPAREGGWTWRWMTPRPVVPRLGTVPLVSGACPCSASLIGGAVSYWCVRAPWLTYFDLKK